MPKITIDFDRKPKFTRPELLTHPPIPPALHGVNPRTIRGPAWWDSVRFPIYAENNYCCWACGDHADPLHAHEAYEFDIEKCIASLKELVALCIPCHKFVHIVGTFIRDGRFTYYDIRAHGQVILSDAGLEPHWIIPYIDYIAENKRAGRSEILEATGLDGELIEMWLFDDSWKMVIDGEEYDRHSKPVRKARIERRKKRWLGTKYT